MQEPYSRLAERALRDEPPGEKEALWILDGEDVELLPLLHAAYQPRARHFGRSILAFFRSLVGGEIIGYTKVIAEAREQAMDRMIEDAKKMGANAILGVRFASTEVMSNAAELVIYGTAAVIAEEEEQE